MQTTKKQCNNSTHGVVSEITYIETEGDFEVGTMSYISLDKQSITNTFEQTFNKHKV